MSDTIVLIGYVIVGLITAFSTSVLVYYNDWEDGMAEILFPLLAGFFWPAAYGILVLWAIVYCLSGGAERVANRIKANRG